MECANKAKAVRKCRCFSDDLASCLFGLAELDIQSTCLLSLYLVVDTKGRLARIVGRPTWSSEGKEGVNGSETERYFETNVERWMT